MKKFTLALAAVYLASGLTLSIARAESAPVGEKKEKTVGNEQASEQTGKEVKEKKDTAKTEPVKAESADATNKDEKVAGKEQAKVSEETSEGTGKKDAVTEEKKDEKKIEKKEVKDVKKDEKKTEY